MSSLTERRGLKSGKNLEEILDMLSSLTERRGLKL